MTKLTKNEKILRKGNEKWKNFLAEGAFKKQVDEGALYHGDDAKDDDGNPIDLERAAPGTMWKGKPIQIDDNGQRYIILDNGKILWATISDEYVEEKVNEARMGEYGKIDAEDGNPPTKIGRGNEEYMAAYNAVLVARGEEPLEIQKPDQAYLDALQQGRMKPSDHSYNLEEQEKKSFKVGEFVYVVNGSLKGATGKVIELTTTTTGEEGYVIELYSAADKRVFGQRGDEVIATADEMESGGTTDDMELYDIDEKKNLKEEVIEDFAIELEGGMTFADVEEAGLVTPGVDSVIDNGDGYAQVYAEPEAMMAMAKTLQAMTGIMVSPESHGAVDEEMSKKDFVQMVRDKGKVPNLKGDMGPISGLEGPFQYRSGAVLYYDPKAGKYYDRGRDMYLDDQEAAELTMESNPSSFSKRVTHSSDPEMDQVMDIAADMLELGARSRIPVSLVGVESALQKQGFDTKMEKGKLIVDDKYVIADKSSLPATAQKISFTKYAADYLSNIEGEQLDLPMDEQENPDFVTSYSADPHLDQIEDYALTVIEKGGNLRQLEDVLNRDGFATFLNGDVLTIDDEFFVGNEENFDISPGEDVRRLKGSNLVVGRIG